ncbi:hypothetical protein QLX08_006279 [Tetragonisca angustula]|uniref:Transcriptional regulatory protein n=1 Tax=Tetragonisca angustula TaxID=166442 RepID=A0AAW0ZUD7_9HYME
MNFRNLLFYTKYKNILFQETKHYAGHSKWKNIKATKEANDAAKSILFQSISYRMKAVALETGDPDPYTNIRLAQLVEHAKKVNMPASTLKGILEKIQTKSGETHILPMRLSKGPAFVIYFVTDKLVHIKFHIVHISKKFNIKPLDTSTFSHMFDCASFIIASKDCTLEEAMEDAIKANAEDVEEIEHETGPCFKFKGEFLHPEKITTKLGNLEYTIISTESTCVPNVTAEVTEEELLNINKYKKKITTDIREIVKIEDNIV